MMTVKKNLTDPGVVQLREAVEENEEERTVLFLYSGDLGDVHGGGKLVRMAAALSAISQRRWRKELGGGAKEGRRARVGEEDLAQLLCDGRSR
jgi:hypothetical protein